MIRVYWARCLINTSSDQDASEPSSRGGEEEKPELRRRGDGVRWARRRSRSGYGAMPSYDGARLERRRSLSCDSEMPRGDGVGRKRRRSRSCDGAATA